MKIYLLRHGESVDDIEDAYGGIADYPLTDAGKKTAQDLATKLEASGIQVLYSSPYKRAQETANFVATAIKSPCKIVDDLRERNSYGVLSGVNKAKAKEIFPSVFANLIGKAGDYYSSELVVGAEDLNSFDGRVKSAIMQIIQDSSSFKIIGIVTHGNVTRSIYKNILGITGKVELDLLAVTVIDYSNNKFSIEKKEGVEVKS